MSFRPLILVLGCRQGESDIAGAVNAGLRREKSVPSLRDRQ